MLSNYIRSIFTTVLLVGSSLTASADPLCDDPVPTMAPTIAYPAADAAFVAGHYREAFTAYYQTFFCVDDPLFLGISPSAEDSGARSYLRTALSEAVVQHYGAAEAQLRSGVTADPSFAEGQLLLGNVQWAAGNRQSARVWWAQAAKNPGYPQPPDLRTVPLPVASARALLAWSRGK